MTGQASTQTTTTATDVFACEIIQTITRVYLPEVVDTHGGLILDLTDCTLIKLIFRCFLVHAIYTGWSARLRLVWAIK